MWAALGNCYEKMDKHEEAIKCTQKAERVKDKEAIALHKLAKLQVQTREFDKAAACFQDNLARQDKEEIQTNETVEALRYLANYYKSKMDLGRAQIYA